MYIMLLDLEFLICIKFSCVYYANSNVQSSLVKETECELVNSTHLVQD
jgi:hypothetical protein